MDIKMRSVSHPGTHHFRVQLNLRPHVYGSKFFFGRRPKSFASQTFDRICQRRFDRLKAF